MENFKEERIMKLHRKIANEIIQFMLEPKEMNEVKDRITDVAYVLCSAIALHISLVSKMGNSSTKDILDLTKRTIENFLEDKSYMKMPKEILKDITLKELLENSVVLPLKDVDGKSPKKIKELSGWVAGEVIRTLKAEGYDIGDNAKGGVMFKRDDNGKITNLVLEVDFGRQEGGKG